LKNYSKEWDNIRNCWKDKPLHNEYSHPADMVRYRAVSKRQYATKSKVKVKARVRVRGVVDGLCM